MTPPATRHPDQQGPASRAGGIGWSFEPPGQWYFGTQPLSRPRPHVTSGKACGFSEPRFPGRTAARTARRRCVEARLPSRAPAAGPGTGIKHSASPRKPPEGGACPDRGGPASSSSVQAAAGPSAPARRDTHRPRSYQAPAPTGWPPSIQVSLRPRAPLRAQHGRCPHVQRRHPGLGKEAGRPRLPCRLTPTAVPRG